MSFVSSIVNQFNWEKIKSVRTKRWDRDDAEDEVDTDVYYDGLDTTNDLRVHTTCGDQNWRRFGGEADKHDNTSEVKSVEGEEDEWHDANSRFGLNLYTSYRNILEEHVKRLEICDVVQSVFYRLEPRIHFTTTRPTRVPNAKLEFKNAVSEEPSIRITAEPQVMVMHVEVYKSQHSILMHCPGKSGLFRGCKCDPEVQREDDHQRMDKVVIKQYLKPEGRIPMGRRLGRVQLQGRLNPAELEPIVLIKNYEPHHKSLHNPFQDLRSITSSHDSFKANKPKMSSPNSDSEIQADGQLQKKEKPITLTKAKYNGNQSTKKLFCENQKPDSDAEQKRVFIDDTLSSELHKTIAPEDVSNSTSNPDLLSVVEKPVHGQNFAKKVVWNEDVNDSGNIGSALDGVVKIPDTPQNVQHEKAHDKPDDVTNPTIGEYLTRNVTFPVSDNWVHRESINDVVLEFIDGLHNQFVQTMQSRTDLSVTDWISGVTCFLHKVKDLCRDAYTKTESLSTAEEIGSAMHIVNQLSLYQFELLTTTSDLNNNGRNIFLFACYLLENMEVAKIFLTKSNYDDDWYNTKFDMLKNFMISKVSDKGFTRIPENCDWLIECAVLLGDLKLVKQIQAKKSNPSRRHQLKGCGDAQRERERLFVGNNLHLIVADGNVYDRARDPPGQRSVYIPPGDANMESYRLSTFIKYPQEVPVNPRHLASAGFFYTGYKDRVKCFSCGLCCENWVFGDDVRSAQWHRSDCAFMRGGDSGNVLIGGGGLARFMVPSRSQDGSHAMDSAPSLSNFTASSGTAQQVQQNSQVPSAGSVLLSHSAGSNQPVPLQTARPVARNQPLFQIVEFATIPSAYHENFLKNLDLRKESERVRTFEHWPSERPTVYPADLARSGFFYLGNLDRVQCFSCGGVLRNWNYGDNVQAEHRRHFPHCKMCQGPESRNVQLTPDERAAVPSQQTVFHEPPDPSENEARDLQNMFQCQYPVSPHMRNEDTRFETFDHRWPASQVNATPRQISRAGFFFLGERDRVKCWYCNGGLQNWDPQDEPWTEHAKWFPTCEFLLQRKGPDFVHRMVSMFPNLPRPLLRGPHDVAPPNPGRRIQYGTASARAPSPPPPIIDPQAEMQRERQKIQDAMNSDIVKAAIEMGFDRKVVRHVVKRRIRRAAMCTTVAELVDDVTGNTSDLSDSDDEENENSMQAQPSTSAKTPGTGGQPESTSSSMSGQPIPAGLAAASHLSSMENEERTPSMQERIEELQEERKCKICLDNMADVVFVPCGHLCSCVRCAEALRKCPMCRQRIEKAIRTYMS